MAENQSTNQNKSQNVSRGPGNRRGPHGPRPSIDHPVQLIKRILSYVMKHYGPLYFLAIGLIFVNVLANVRGTMFMQTLIDQYIMPMLKDQSHDFGPLLRAMAKVGAFYLCGVLAVLVQSQLMVNITQGTLNSMRKELYNHMQDLPIKYFDTHAHGDIMSIYTNDIDTLRQLISQSIPQLIQSGLNVVSTLVCMVILNIPLTILTLCMVGVTLIVTRKLASLSSHYFVRQQKDLGAVNGFVEEMLSGQKIVKVFNHEEKNIEDFNRINDQLQDSANKANRYANVTMPANGQIGNISYVLVAIFGGILAIRNFGGFTLGKLASFLTFNKGFNMPISQVSQQVNFIVMGMAGAQRIFNLLDEKPELDQGYVMLVNARIDEDGTIHESRERTGSWAWKHFHKADGTTTYQKQEGHIELLGVDFGYTENKMVLHDIEMFAKPGQKIALVGSTGAGKTTITNLINRFYDIQDGKIRYDHININKIKKADLRRSLGMVLQDTHLFTDTVRENIRYGKLDASDEEVIAAAKLANAHSFIEKLPQGYDTVLTGDGANLSQGQRQLLNIARAAIADPPALILDEATSSIDTRTEKIVQEGMDKLMKGRTTFVIAHRLSTIQNSDCIMVLEQGRIIERGNHDELIAAKGRYYQLYTGNQIVGAEG